MNLDNIDLSTIDFSLIPHEYKEELIQLLEKREEWIKYNKLATFKPYKFQTDFYDASAKSKRRFLCAANR